MWQSLEILNAFNTLTLIETNFPENENLFQKTEAPFLSWSTKIENASFLLKKCHVRSNGEYKMDGVLPLKILFQFKNLL